MLGLAAAAFAQSGTATFTGTGALTGATSFSMIGTANLPGLGIGTYSGAGTIDTMAIQTGQNSMPITGSFSIIYPDGGVLYGTFVFPVGYLIPQAGMGIVTTGTITIKGGTGRFEGAGGTFSPLTGAGTQTSDTSSTYQISGSGSVAFGQKILPQLAFGGGWYTALYFTNTTSAAVSFPVTFTSDNGSPLSIASLGGATTTANIPAGGSIRLEAPNTGDLSQGFASANVPAGVNGYAVFRQSGGTIADQEAVAPLSNAASTTAAFLFDDTNYITGVSIVNPGNAAATVTVTAKNAAGGVIGTGTVSLAAKNKTALVLRNITGLGGVAGSRGVVTFSSTGPIAVLGLRFFGSAFTSIPVTN
ncbi:MAG: hypothetical protein ABI823_16535 [Bryobacteraceae bacterium]